MIYLYIILTVIFTFFLANITRIVIRWRQYDRAIIKAGAEMAVKNNDSFYLYEFCKKNRLTFAEFVNREKIDRILEENRIKLGLLSKEKKFRFNDVLATFNLLVSEGLSPEIALDRIRELKKIPKSMILATDSEAKK